MSETWIWIGVAWAYVVIGIAVMAYTDDSAPDGAGERERFGISLAAGVLWPIAAPAFWVYSLIKWLGGGK